MSLYNGPARGGTRGGKDQFNWESVKADKDREFYLGHSVKATTGRWQKHKDVYWYTREKGDSSDPVAEELRRVRDREEQLMMEALGVKPKEQKAVGSTRLNKQDMQQLTQQSENEPDARPDQVKGLGYDPTGVQGQIAHTDVLPGSAPLQASSQPSSRPSVRLRPCTGQSKRPSARPRRRQPSTSRGRPRGRQSTVAGKAAEELSVVSALHCRPGPLAACCAYRCVCVYVSYNLR